MHTIPQRALCFLVKDTATTDIYTLSLHDALPIYVGEGSAEAFIDEPVRLPKPVPRFAQAQGQKLAQDRKSTRLNSSHTVISYAVFCLKKKSIAESILGAVSRRRSQPGSKNAIRGG